TVGASCVPITLVPTAGASASSAANAQGASADRASRVAAFISGYLLVRGGSFRCCNSGWRGRRTRRRTSFKVGNPVGHSAVWCFLQGLVGTEVVQRQVQILQVELGQDAQVEMGTRIFGIKLHGLQVMLPGLG